MKHNRNKVSVVLAMITWFVMVCPVTVLAAEEAAKPAVYATFWSLIPPVVAIGPGDHERGIQLFVPWDPGRCNPLFRR